VCVCVCDLGAADDVDFVGDGREDQQEPDARSAQRRDQHHLLSDDGSKFWG